MKQRHSTYLGRVGKPRTFLNLVLEERAQGGKQWAWEVCGVEKRCPQLVYHSSVAIYLGSHWSRVPCPRCLRGEHI